MNSERIANWIQVVTGVAVVAGLVLVIWELQQSRDLAYVQVAVDAYAIDSQEYATLLGENPSAVLSKDCLNQELTNEEQMVLHSYYQMLTNRAGRMRWINEAGFTEFNWKSNARTDLAKLFDTAGGRKWWKDVAVKWEHPELVKLGNELIGQSAPSCGSPI